MTAEKNKTTRKPNQGGNNIVFAPVSLARTARWLLNHLVKQLGDQYEKYIFRGEDGLYKHPVSCGLYRELPRGKGENPQTMADKYQDTLRAEAKLVEAIKGDTAIAHSSDVDIITSLQHYGCPTSYIDFSMSLLIALFHACYGKNIDREDGIIYMFPLILFLPQTAIEYDKTRQTQDILISASVQEPRARAQSSVFVRPAKGFLDCDGDERIKKVIIPGALKQEVLNFLLNYFNIGEQGIFPDIHRHIANREVYSRRKAREYREEGTQCRDNGDYAAAISQYKQAIVFEPTWAVLYYEQGLTLFAQGDYAEAIKCYDKTIRLAPRMVPAFVGRASAKANSGDYQGAIRDCGKAIRINPESAEAYHIGYTAKAEIGDTRGARSYYQKLAGLIQSWEE